MVKEKTLEILHQLGFAPEELEDNMGYRFEYEGLNLLYVAEDDDANCLTFMLPGIFDVTEENGVAVMGAMLQLCAKLKYIQPVILHDSVWLQYQHFMPDGAEPTPEIIEHIVIVLAAGIANFQQILEDYEE